MSIVSWVVDEVLKLEGPAAYALVGGLAFGESALFVGFVLPGETAVLLGGVLANQHRVSLTLIASVAVVGAILGDAVSFELGRYFGDRILRFRVFHKHQPELQRGLAAVRRHGGRAVFLARFVGFLRAVMPGLAGTARMPSRRFFVFNALGGLIWAVGFTLLGYAAGASYQRVESLVGTASTVVLCLVVLGLAALLVRRRVGRKPHGPDPGEIPWGSAALSSVESDSTGSPQPGRSNQRVKGGPSMPRAVRFDDYGGVEVLEVRDVPRPSPGPGQVLVEVRAAGINIGEAKIRSGAVRQIFPATFPSGEGSDLAGVVREIGEGVAGVSVGDEVIGFTDDRASHAELVLVEAVNLTPKPAGIPWEVAGVLFVAGATGFATVRAVAPRAGEAVVVAGAGGGVGVFAVQLAVKTGARVIALASERHHAWLRERGAVPVAYGDGVRERIAEAAHETPVRAFIDLVGDGYVELALELGIAKERIDTVVDFPAIAKHGVKGEGGAAASSATTLATLAQAISAGDLVVPIQRAYPLDEVRAAFSELESGHVAGKIVLVP